ncbi:MAG TPA: polysaccharide deacetylase family protein [Xanthomonadales bacterium]|nr:polysaccharide deacetylase family protein [Xanthomonadales bacterium]
MKWFRPKQVSVPVLTYHSINIDANTYAQNDHIAFAEDLRTIDRLGMKVIPLQVVVDWNQGKLPDSAVEGGVALTLDDGTSFDFFSIEHPTCGMQTGMFRLLEEFRNEVGVNRQPALHVSSFVIVSPAAREELDRKNMVGKSWWGDDWWREAQSSGLMSIECHSWDHNHPTLDQVAQQDNRSGDFRLIASFEDCQAQLDQAGEYIEKVAGYRPRYFAYPWGQSSDYLRQDYLPNQQNQHRFEAAFSIDAEPVTKRSDRWFLPRYVCGRDWQSPEQFEAILKA